MGILGLIINVFLILVFIGALAEADDYDYDYYGDADYYDTSVEDDSRIFARDVALVVVVELGTGSDAVLQHQDDILLVVTKILGER